MRFLGLCLSLVCLIALTVSADASGKRRSRGGCESCSATSSCSNGQCSAVSSSSSQCANGVCNMPAPAPSALPVASSTGSADALDEVNAYRAKKGLRPFIGDPLLTQAANACAKQRAATHCHGHLASDFAYLPAGAVATAAGCGALEPSWGWGTCCADDNYTYAGAAWVMGSDGRRYMHLFVR